MAGAGSAQIHWGRQISVTLIWLIVICGGAWFILRLFYSSGPGLGGFGRRTRKLIHVLDRQVLGPQKALLLVEVPGKVVLIGLTDQQIRTLAELSPDDLLEGEEAEEATASTSVPLEMAHGTEEGDGAEEQRLAELFGRRSNDSTTPLGRP